MRKTLEAEKWKSQHNVLVSPLKLLDEKTD